MIHFFFLIAVCFVNCLHAEEKEFSAPSVNVSFLTVEELESKSGSTMNTIAEFDPKYTKIVLEPQHFPTEKRMMFAIDRPIREGEGYRVLAEFKLRKDGTIVSADNIKQIFPYFVLSTRGYLPGERIHCRFTSLDGSFRYQTSFIPNPIKVQDASGLAAIQAELTKATPALYSISFEGFEKDEPLAIFCVSGRDKIRKSFTFGKEEKITYSPNHKSKKGGLGKFIVTRESGEQIEMDLPWGEKLLDQPRVVNNYKAVNFLEF